MTVGGAIRWTLRRALPAIRRALRASPTAASALLLLQSVADATPTGLTRGPYLQRLTPTSVTIVWNTPSPADCGVRIRPLGGSPTVIEGGMGTVCAIPVEGLTPGTVYGYVPLADGIPLGAESAFRTDHGALPFSFIVVGDSGSGRAEQTAVRDAMLTRPADFLLHTGDMIYPAARRAEWNPKYFAPYAQLLRKSVFWPCLGNHDVNDDDGASWRAAFYTPANNAAGDEGYYSFDHGNAHVVVLDSNRSLKPGSAQHTFLGQDLTASTATWNFVAFHHPVYSSGEHGSSVSIRDSLGPVFDAHGVDIVFMGHDHDYERTPPLVAGEAVGPGEGTVYVVTGGGGAEIRDVGSSSFTAYAEATLHFVHVSIAGEMLELEMVRADGSIGDALTLLKGPPPLCGDDSVNQVGEQCDGTDDVACPGACDATCRCPAVCGDGKLDPLSEECDFLADAACPGLCIEHCLCAEPPPVLDLIPVADTYVEAGVEAMQGHGASTELNVDAQPAGITYLKFDLTSISSGVQSALLTLSCTNASGDGGTLYPVPDSSWVEGEGGPAGESGLRWIDVDSNGDGAIDGNDGSPYVPRFDAAVASLGEVEIDESYQVVVTEAFQEGPGFYTLAIASDSQNGAGYASRESSPATDRPSLRVELALQCVADADCQDGLYCTGTELCIRGHCIPGVPVACEDTDPCTIELCDEDLLACRFEPASDGDPCDDGDACTVDDSCVAGTCAGTDEVHCSALDQCHNAGACDPASGLCSNPPKPDGAPCDDSNPCTVGDRCVAGGCTGGDPVVCTPADQCHDAGACDPASGLCSNPGKPDGAPCNDDDLCTLGDMCVGGSCQGMTPVVCTADQCHQASCDPATGSCSTTPKPNGAACDDGDLCTLADTCVAGTCTGADPVDCAAADQCHVAGACNPLSGLCSNPTRPDGAACEDGDLCTLGESCIVGICTGGEPVVCTPSDQCHDAGACEPATGLCSNPPRPDGTTCDDGNLCTLTDRCIDGSCIGTDPPACPATDQCHDVGACEPATGLCSNPPKPDGTVCDDGDLCTLIDRCIDGSCTGTDPLSCPATDQCHDAGTCNPASGLCSNPLKPDGAPCDDGDPCTLGDACTDGGCTRGDPVVCTPADQCHHAGTCNPATGLCSNPSKPDGTTCDDGDLCTLIDECLAGACTATVSVVCAPSDQCHDTGACDPATGVCSNPLKSDGVACDDGNPCTLGDACIAGTCTGADPAVCVPSDQCHDAGVCDPATGLCSNPPKPNGVACDDGNLCTLTDRCLDGSCIGADPLVCTATDQCHDPGTCNPASGLCSNPSKPDGTTCDDGDLCTLTDECLAGACTPTVSVVCTPSDQCHDAGACDPATGLCSNPLKSDGAPCDDGNPCTLGDACIAGTCTNGDPAVCTPSDQCHDAGVCDPATGLCSNPPRPDGAACEDDNPCTLTDRCLDGSCIGADPLVCTATDQCHDAGVCDPATGLCSNPPRPDGTACDDGDLCTPTDRCTDGSCIGTDPLVCPAIDQCHDAGACDPASGLCSNPAKLDDAACEDGNPCTVGDACIAGACTGGEPAVCVPSDQCHDAGVCDPATGLCSNPAKPDGAACEDGNPCTLTDRCLDGSCMGADALVCTATDQCHDTGVCNPATGLCSNPLKPDGTACDDGDLCTLTDECLVGACAGTVSVVCAASDPCHDAGVCDPATGVCSNPLKPDGAPCDDGSLCTLGDACIAGICTGGEPVACTPTDQCHDPGACDPATGLCSNPPKPDGTACDDGDLCTLTDGCLAGACAGAVSVVCAASDQCHDAGTCNPATGLCSNPPKPDGAACDDGNLCTPGDACMAGGCTGGEPVACTPTDECHDPGACDPATGLCSSPSKPDGAACDDGNRCTVGDACTAGGCTGGEPIACTPIDQCHAAGTCDPATGVCSQPAVADGVPCNDGNACTRADTCMAGFCMGMDPVACAAAPCHEAVCVPETGLCSTAQSADGSPCDDGDACTKSDTCAAGACVGGDKVDCSADQCHDGGTCDPATGLCSSSPRVNGTPCDDGAFCTVGDACRAGACAGGPRDCSASGADCTLGVCSETQDACLSQPKSDGTPCDDGNACTARDVCVAGVCTGSVEMQCAPLGPCQDAGACDAATGACSTRPKADGSPCDDDDPCTENDQCLAGTCAGQRGADGDADGLCDFVDLCPSTPDPEQLDSDHDGIGDLCQCTAPLPGRCIAGGGSSSTDCMLEFLAHARVELTAHGTRVKPVVRCTDGDTLCDLDGARDGKCTVGVALCFGNSDPRYPRCAPDAAQSVEVLWPSAVRKRSTADRDNARRLETMLAAAGLEVRRRDRVISEAVTSLGNDTCTAPIHLVAPAPRTKQQQPVRRVFKLEARGVDGQRDRDRFAVICR